MHNVISVDRFLYDRRGRYAWTPDRVTKAWGEALSATKAALATGPFDKVILTVGLPGSGKSAWVNHEAMMRPKVLFFDSTLTTCRRRAPVILAVRQINHSIEAVLFNTPFDIIVARNKARTLERRVPLGKLRAMQKTFEEPTLQEGFICIHEVSYAPQTVSA